MPVRARLALLLAALVALAASAAQPASGAPARAAATQIVYIANGFAVQNGPSAPSAFTTTATWHVVEIWTYHWNDGKGASPGTIAIREVGGGKLYGPFAASGAEGQGGVADAYWVASVSFDLPPGDYEVVDSDPSTWAQNAESDHRGMTWILATPVKACAPARELPPHGLAPAGRPAALSAQDCSPPKVRAFRVPGFVKPGTRITLGFSVKDDSGRANARITLFEGGQYVRNASYSGKATGRKLSWTVTLPANLKGPMFFCVWAKDAAKNKSVGSPRSSCAWIKLVVPIARVSNGCGGEGWDAVVAVENHFGNTSTYYGEDGTPYAVSFVDACNLHDAGYGGQTVYDKINGVTIDYHDWSRGEVDEKFRRDMEKLCEQQIPAEEQRALAECKANFRYPTVRTVGDLFFDADPMTVGTQGTGTRSND